MKRELTISGLTLETPLREASLTILKAKAKPIFELEAATRSGKDIEALHDMRVASRRLREALRVFRALYRKKAFKKHFGSVRAVTRALGKARNYDVCVAFFENYQAELSDQEIIDAVDFLLKRQRKGQKRERKKMVQQLDALDLPRLERRLNVFFADQKKNIAPGDGDMDPAQDLIYNTRMLVERRLKTMFEHRTAIEDESRVDLLHQTRIATKKLRYAMETLYVAFDDSFDACYDTVKQIQEMLGNIHDLDVFIEMVNRTKEKVEGKRKTRMLVPGMVKLAVDLRSRRRELYMQFMALIREYDEDPLTEQILNALVTDHPSAMAANCKQHQNLGKEVT